DQVRRVALGVVLRPPVHVVEPELGAPVRPLLGWGGHAPAPPRSTGGRAASITTTTSPATTTPDAALSEGKCVYSRNAPLVDVTGHGLGSHEPGPIAVPPSSWHSVAVSCSHSPASPCWFSSPCASSFSGTQHRTTPGIVGAHGLGSHVPAPRFTPFSPAHSAALVCSHSGPSSSGMQQVMNAPPGQVTQGSGTQDPAPMLV